MEKAFLEELYVTAVRAADPESAVAKRLPKHPRGRTVVIGAGKAAVPMLRGLRSNWDGSLSGVIVAQEAQNEDRSDLRVYEASHPLPDERGLKAAAQLRNAIKGLSEEDLVIALISGGGSALLPAPPAGFTLADEQALGTVLLRSGAPIAAVNAVRKHFSDIKGGRLAASTKAKMHTLVVSDIPGDVAAQVASGPTIPDEATRQDALEAIRYYHLPIPAHVLSHIASAEAEAPKPSDPIFAGHEHAVVASSRLSLNMAADLARRQGVRAAILSDALQGEAREAGGFHAALTREIREHAQPFSAPVVLLSGGETTVTVRGRGKGGRNGEFLLAWAIAMDGLPGVSAIAADTDGIDGSEHNAGAFADGTTAQRLRDRGLDPRQCLADNNSYAAFSALGDLLVTGPTGTNVNDFRAIFIR